MEIETKQIVKGVFIGMWLFTLSSAIITLAVVALLRWSGDIR